MSMDHIGRYVMNVSIVVGVMTMPKNGLNDAATDDDSNDDDLIVCRLFNNVHHIERKTIPIDRKS